MSGSATESGRAMVSDRPLYGNWVLQRSSGIGGAGLIGTAVGIGGLGITMIALIAGGIEAGLVAAMFAVAAFTATTATARRGAARVGFTVSRMGGHHQWRSGMFSRNANPSNRLPGMLGGIELLEHRDAFGVHGESFAVLYSRRGDLYTVVARCVADGPWMQDQTQVNFWVAGYSEVLAGLGHEPSVVCAKAITDTAPDPGGKLASMVAGGRAVNAPALARVVMDEVVAQAPATSSENVTYFEVTFRGWKLNRKGDRAAILGELARRVPGLRGRLAAAGGGAVGMVSAAELCTIVRSAYDPAAQKFLEQAALAGHTDTVAWHEAGPVASQEAWDHLLHDSGHSVTWEMPQAPRASVSERSLTSLLAPHSDFARKRVALIYRPHSPAESAEVSERDVDSAVFNADQGKKRISARQRLRVRSVERSRDEVALGAGLVRFSVMVTATVASGGPGNGRGVPGGDIDQAVSTVEGAAAAMLLGLRRCYGSQAAAFAATLPVGLVPWEHTVIPDKVREML